VDNIRKKIANSVQAGVEESFTVDELVQRDFSLFF
jgi:hypothetical protein